MIAKITAPDLARDVTSAELQLAAHKEYKAEIDARKEAFERFIHTGNGLIADGHFLADEIQDKVQTLTQRRELLIESGKRREDIYLQNLDALYFERDAAQLELWLISREKLLVPDNLGSSILEVEDLIRRHEDFEKTLEAQDDKATALKRTTLVKIDFYFLYLIIFDYNQGRLRYFKILG